eukprot:790275-Pyramimonas_sp.AAC.1
MPSTAKQRNAKQRQASQSNGTSRTLMQSNETRYKAMSRNDSTQRQATPCAALCRIVHSCSDLH